MNEFDSYAFDIVLNDEKELVIKEYGVNIKCEIVNEKRHPKYEYSLIKSYVSEDIEQDIAALKSNGFLRLIYFENSENIIYDNNINKLKIFLLSYKNKIIEKCYEIIDVDGKTILNGFIVYVNQTNGKIDYELTASIDITNNYDEMMKILNEYNYCDIENSFLRRNELKLSKNKEKGLN